MINNYFKIAWRNLVKNKTVSFINIFGLAIGLACFFMIAAYVTDELSYDRHHEHASNIYRVESTIKFGETEQRLAVCSDAMGPVLKKDYPEVEQFVRIYNSDGDRRVKKGNVFITEQDVASADSTIFDVFTLPAIHGDTKTALNEPNTVVITEKTALKYFGSSDVVGKMLETSEDQGRPYKITAVIKDMPVTSHFNFDFIFSMDNVSYNWGNFLSHNFQTYILLKKGVDPNVFEGHFKEVIKKYVLPQASQNMNIGSMDDFEKSGNKLEYTLMPLTDIHLRSDRSAELGVNGSIQYVYIFSAVALFILLIACVNFMNLSTARSSARAREVGIRKVLGTDRRTLISQFLFESVFISFIAMIFSIAIAWMSFPFFNDISGKSLSLLNLWHSAYLPVFLLVPLIVGLLAGSYPAFFLSSFQPIKVLKGKPKGSGKSFFRSSLVVFQFATSIILIIGTIVVYRQLGFIQKSKLGFDKEQVLVINGTGALRDQANTFKEEIKGLPGVINGTFSGFLPVSSSARNDNTFSREAVMDAKNGFNMQLWPIEEDYIPTLGITINKGRNFSKDFGTDSSAVILNEAAAALLGHADPIGKKIFTNDRNGNTIGFQIIGIVENFHFESLRQGIGPLCFVYGPSPWATAFRINTADISQLIGLVESKWKTMVPAMPFSYRFLDDAFDEMYRTEQRISKVAIAFAVLAILIASLGLFGLATYMADQRTREIGVRKVLGASVGRIVGLLSTDFLKLIFIATFIAFPVAWWLMDQWLQDFAFRIRLHWSIFMLAGLLAITIAMVTISYQAIRAAMANPAKTLRTD
jgi:putative ABC transport system permease protein